MGWDLEALVVASLRQGTRFMRGRRRKGRQAQMMPTLASTSVQVERGINDPSKGELLVQNIGFWGAGTEKGRLRELTS
jgi:hypothetical protein